MQSKLTSSNLSGMLWEGLASVSPVQLMVAYLAADLLLTHPVINRVPGSCCTKSFFLGQLSYRSRVALRKGNVF